ncbi:hypothetical protein KI743_07770 [Vibrio sp. D420a]|uniref:hypothetical protein n=1 Tax=Vibrio sp. D420a TaxID=2836895 RepID=UPI002554975D|nr:hypothetical protein [Vibrio sp. D420a]MDK9761898.1 hypothetical protein [Vibrio sp. D420a]
MRQKSVQRPSQPRIPLTIEGIDVNRCSNPSCVNFDIEASTSRTDVNYSVSGNKRNGSSLRCKKCGGFNSIKSNKAIAEELERMEALKERSTIYRQDGTACHKLDCPNFGKRFTAHPDLYKLNGKTSKGKQRLKCLCCKTSFTHQSDKRKSHPDSKSHQNVTLFRLLVNDMSINRIMEVTELSAPTIYRKIDMFYERCISFAYHRERNLRQMKLEFMRLSTDRQEYHVNWSNRKDKKNIILNAIGTADKASRYVFGMDVNYDPCMSLDEIESTAEFELDTLLKDYNREFARVWTTNDYQLSKNLSGELAAKQKDLIIRFSSQPLPLSDIGFDYFKEQLSVDYGLDAFGHNSSTKLPQNGVLVHSEYTMYAHFLKLASLIGHAEGLRFYLDKEPAINRACHLAFADNVLEGTAHSLYVKINKNLTVDQRRALVNASQIFVKQVQEENCVDEEEARKIIALHSIENPITFKGKSDNWYTLPIDKIYECQKYVSFLTPIQSVKHEQLAMMLLDASLHPIDNFFQIVRRRLSSLERPISTSSNAGRVWTGKSPYNPAMINKLLQILRVFYNYCYISKTDGLTAAERIGLAKGAVEIRKILYPW